MKNISTKKCRLCFKVLTPQQREEQVREESKLLNNLKKNLVAKKAVLEDDLRGKLELKKIKMLDSRNSFIDGIFQGDFKKRGSMILWLY